MIFPSMENVPNYNESTKTFGGYNHNYNCPEGQFYEMKNMSSDYYPSLSPRTGRRIVEAIGHIEKADIVASDTTLTCIDGSRVLINGYPIIMPQVYINPNTKKKILYFGSKLIILPDKVYIDMNDDSGGYIEHEISNVGAKAYPFFFELCDRDYAQIVPQKENYYDTHTPVDGDYKLFRDGNLQMHLQRYVTDRWMDATDTYIKIFSMDHLVDIREGFEVGDVINIDTDWSSTPPHSERDLLDFFTEDEYRKLHAQTDIIAKIVDDDGYKCIIVNGKIYDNYEETHPCTIKRAMPDMEYVIECNNRLWGCSKDGREIYASKLGDFKNWSVFQGISTDAWAASVGSDGKFTGAISYLGNPVFFKEDRIIRIIISATGAHQIKETICDGVQIDSSNSVCLLNGYLIYKGRDGIFTYNGSMPNIISESLGKVRYSKACASTMDNKYYISMTRDDTGEREMLVYDTKNGTWSKEDDVDVIKMVPFKGDIFYLDRFRESISSINKSVLSYYIDDEGNEKPRYISDEGKIGWMVESGMIGYADANNKYIKHINVRMSLELGTNVDCFVSYDDGPYHHAFNLAGVNTRIFGITVATRRCNHFRYKLVGTGGCKIYSINKTMEEGSDI